MNDFAEIVVLVEGPTEKIFIDSVLAPYLVQKQVIMRPIIISKHGQKGGDVKFARVVNDIRDHLKQRGDTWLTLLLDFYGIKEWPGLDEARMQRSPAQKAQKFHEMTKVRVVELFGEWRPDVRFLPYVAMHEFEALLFSHPQILADQLGVEVSEINEILTECGDPEKINNSPDTAPSKRLENLCERYKKTSTGITIAKAIGIDTMRRKCPLFNAWLVAIEELPETQAWPTKSVRP